MFAIILSCKNVDVIVKDRLKVAVFDCRDAAIEAATEM